MNEWKIIGRLGGLAVKWRRIGDKDAERITITRENRRSSSGGLGGVRYVIRADNVDREYRALTLTGAKDYAKFWVDVWSEKYSKIIRD